MDKQRPDSKRLHRLILVISSGLIVCNIIRMAHVSVTHDEAQCYETFISGSFGHIFSYDILTANNHFLNSILAWLSIHTFKDNLFFLRLPGLIAQVVYLTFTFLLAKKLFSDHVWILCCFLLFQLNPFLFDFWGLCRGYALGIACMVASMYYLLKYLEQEKLVNLSFSSLFMIGAIYANLSLLNYATGFYAVVGVHLLLRQDRLLTIKTLATGAISLIMIYLLIAKPVRVLKTTHQLYYGGETGFITDTIGSLLRESLYLDEGSNWLYIVSLLISLSVILSGIYWIVRSAKIKEGAGRGTALWILLIIPVLSTLVQHYLLDTKYLIDRTALFFYPLFIIQLVYTLYPLDKDKGILKRYVLIPVSILFLGNFLIHFNFSSTRIWSFDRNTPWLMERMVKDKKNGGKIKIYLDWMFTPSIRYYSERRYPGKFGYLEGPMEVAYDKMDYDFYLVRNWEVQKIPAIFTIDTVFAGKKYYLYKRKYWDND